MKRRHFVIAGISLLLVFGLPFAFEQYIQYAKTVGGQIIYCSGNLKQIGIACEQYSERVGVLPNSLVSLSDSGLLPSGKVYVCPLSLGKAPFEDQVEHSTYRRAPASEQDPAPLYYCQHGPGRVIVLLTDGSARFFRSDSYSEVDWSKP
jgi:hypothetical protein